jgi:hypothetical protein
VRWSTPRELLWALIGAQAIAIIALWPTYYPYGRAPKVYPQQQTENGVSGADPTDHRPFVQINPTRENATEISVFGVKPGEWLLSIVTLMLWGATVGLVRSANRTAETQLRAYFDLTSATVMDFVEGGHPNVLIEFKNVGQTPAFDVVCKLSTQIRPIDDEPPAVDIDLRSATASKGTIGRDGTLTTHLECSTLTKHFFTAVKDGEAALFAYGIIRYRDIYARNRYLRFRMALLEQNLSPEGEGIMATCSGGNDAD